MSDKEVYASPRGDKIGRAIERAIAWLSKTRDEEYTLKERAAIARNELADAIKLRLKERNHERG